MTIYVSWIEAGGRTELVGRCEASSRQVAEKRLGIERGAADGVMTELQAIACRASDPKGLLCWKLAGN